MSGLNRVMLLGNVGQEPKLRQASTTEVLELRIATTERIKRDNEWGEATEWHTVVLFGKRAASLARIVHKGEKIFVEGKLRSRSWDKPDGSKGYATEIIADDVILCGSPRRNGPGGEAPSDGHPPDQDPTNGDDMPW